MNKGQYAAPFIGLSPSGKARDFDSLIPWVQIPPVQPGATAPPNPVSGLSEAGYFLPRCPKFRYTFCNAITGAESALTIRLWLSVRGLFFVRITQVLQKSKAFGTYSGERPAANPPTVSSVGGFLCRITNFIRRFD